jgi:NADPH:quinone reductase-like Zn-dependent oxidoreductase
MCEVVFDTVGGETQMRSHELLKPGGPLVWIAAAPQDIHPTRREINIVPPAVFRNRAHFERMLFLL